jgi:hypothetical protein
VGVDHRGGDVLVAKELLHGPDVVPRLEEVSGEGVTKGVAGGGLEDGLVEVVPPALTRRSTASQVRKRAMSPAPIIVGCRLP